MHHGPFGRNECNQRPGEYLPYGRFGVEGIQEIPAVFRARTDVPQGDIAADLFHESVPDAFVAEVFAVMARANWRTFQLLTKRHGRMRVPGRR